MMRNNEESMLQPRDSLATPDLSKLPNRGETRHCNWRAAAARDMFVIVARPRCVSLRFVFRKVLPTIGKFCRLHPATFAGCVR